jgi:dihydropyrimidinase
MFDLTITGGRVVTPTLDAVLDIGVKDGRVVALAAPGLLPTEGTRTIDATGQFVFPGGIDSHVHYDLHLSDAMSAQSSQIGSEAGIWGGTTTYIDFAKQSGDESLVGSIEGKLKVTQSQPVSSDYALHSMLTGAFGLSTPGEITEAISGGINGFKMFTTFSAPPGSSIPGMFTDDGRIYSVMRQVAEAGDGNVLIHAEDDCIIDYNVRRLYAAGTPGIEHVSEARPNLAEEAAIERMILLSRRTGCPLYIVHVSTAEGVEAIARARSQGVRVTGETLHNQLRFTPEVYARPQGMKYMNFPPFKAQGDQDRLWAALAAGELHTVASDDFTIPLDRKLSGSNVDNTTGGHNGVETRMLYLFSEGVTTGRITPQQYADLTATQPAKIFGLHPRKGDIAIGSDADLVLIDPAATTTIDQANLHSGADYSVWDGMTFTGALTATILRGTVLVQNDEWVGPRGAGEFVPSARPTFA